KELKVLKGHDGPVSVVVYTPDGPLSAGFDRTLRLWDADAGSEKAKVGPLPDDPYGLAVAKDGKRVAVAGYGGHVAVWEIPAGQFVFVSPFEVVAPEVGVIGAVPLEVVHDDQDRVSQRDQGALSSPPRRQAAIVRGQVGVLGVRGCPRRLHQRPLEPRTALG